MALSVSGEHLLSMGGRWRAILLRTLPLVGLPERPLTSPWAYPEVVFLAQGNFSDLKSGVILPFSVSLFLHMDTKP